jgi:hypothetical protein
MFKFLHSWKTGAVIGLSIITSFAAVGIGYACNVAYGNPFPGRQSECNFIWAESNDNNHVMTGIDPGDNGNDPSEPQQVGKPCARVNDNVALTRAFITNASSRNEKIKVTLSNAYPGYYPTVFFALANEKQTPGIVKSIDIDNPPETPVTVAGVRVNQIIRPGQTITGAVSVLASDSVKPDNTYTFTVDIVVVQYTAGLNFKITTQSLPDGKTGVFYSQQLTAVSGDEPYYWVISSGNLPSGLTLDHDTGIISGIPKKDGVFNFRVKVTDDSGDIATKSLSIRIKNPVKITTLSLPDGKVKDSYHASVNAAQGDKPYRWIISAGTLPNGLRLNGFRGDISGTPTLAGVSTFTVQVTDADGDTAVKTLSITIKEAKRR